MIVSAAVAGSLVLAALTPSAAAEPRSDDGPPPTGILISAWPLNGNTADVVGDHDLTLSGADGVDYAWVPDRFCFPVSALAFDGTSVGHARTAGTVTPTDTTFTVAAWVYLESTTEVHQTVLSQAGLVQPAMRLQVTPDASVRFSVPTGHPKTGFGTVETEPGSVTAQVWHHLVGTLDLESGEVRLYLNGQLAEVGDSGPAPWRAEGPMFVGVAGTADGIVSQPIHGVVEEVRAWSSTLHPDHISALGAGGGVPTLPCF